MEKQIAVALLVLTLLPGGFGAMGKGLGGVTQDYMEDNVVKVPIGQTVCHRIWAASDPSIEKGQVMIELSGDLPDFVKANLTPDGVYTTTNGGSDAIVFHITAPADAIVGDEFRVGFTVKGVDAPAAGMVPIVGRIGSGFTIRIMDATFQARNLCGALPSDPTEVKKREAEEARLRAIEEARLRALSGDNGTVILDSDLGTQASTLTKPADYTAFGYGAVVAICAICAFVYMKRDKTQPIIEKQEQGLAIMHEQKQELTNIDDRLSRLEGRYGK